MVNMTSRNSKLVATLLYASVVATLARRHPFQPVAHLQSSHRWFPSRQHDLHGATLWVTLRGGSTAAEENEETESPTESSGVDRVASTQDGEDENGEEEEEAEEKEDKPPKLSEPARILVQSNWGNTVIDHRVEILSARTKTIAELKKSVSRKLPGKPPLVGLELVYEGKILEDEMLVDELFDDDEEEEEKDEDGENEGSSKVLTLNSIPPVDPKFATELVSKLKAHIEDDEDTLVTEEMLDAYFMNQAAMLRNAQLLVDPKAPSSPLLRLEIQQQAQKLKEQLRSQIPDDVWEKSVVAIKRNHITEEIKGHRYRSGKGGAKTSLKKSIQTNLNIDWVESIKNCLLLLFFGYFGGRNSLSRTLMVWGAPMVFILQARPVKIWFKILFYMMVNPPAVVSSLLPAPQQAILNADIEKAYAILYNPGDEEAKKASNTVKGRVIAEAAEEEKKPVIEEEEIEDGDDEGEDEESEDEEEY